MNIDWGFIILVAIGTVGLVQWLKGIFPKAQKWVWAILAVLLAFGLAALGSWKLWLLMAAAALAIAQLCYEIIIQALPQLAKGILSQAAGAAITTTTTTTTKESPDPGQVTRTAVAGADNAASAVVSTPVADGKSSGGGME